jgi:hypothetical protein
MDGRRNLRISLLGSIFILTLLLTNGNIASAGAPSPLPTPLLPTPRIIMIYGSNEGKDAVPVEPNKLWVDRFTEITWINASQTDVKIKFGKGTTCREVSTEAFPGLGIRLDPQKCIVTSNPIPPKGKLWFRFEEPGDYRYEVEYLGKREEVSGEVKVF